MTKNHLGCVKSLGKITSCLTSKQQIINTGFPKNKVEGICKSAQNLV